MSCVGTITQISSQKRTNKRVNVFLDGEYAFSIDLDTAAQLAIGQHLDEEDISKLRQSEALQRAKSLAYRYLSYRPRSITEVYQYLRKKEFEEEIIDEAVQRLIELEYLDDYKFAAYWVEQRETFKPRSRFALRSELFAKGVSREVIDQVVSDVDELSAAKKAVANKALRWSSLADDEYKAKINGYLRRRGFDYGVISIVIEELLNRDRPDL